MFFDSGKIRGIILRGGVLYGVPSPKAANNKDGSGNTRMTKKQGSGAQAAGSDDQSISSLDLVSFGANEEPTPELLAQLKTVRELPANVIASMVCCQIDKYLARHPG